MEINPEDVPKVEEAVRLLRKHGKLNCVSCGAPLPLRVKYVSHVDGKLWAYIECPKCGYGNALWKIFKRALPPRPQ